MSKSHKARTIPLLDGRVAERMRERLEGLADDDYVFAAPHGGLWDENNARKALRKLYDELAGELGIPALSQERRVTHMWRTSLNDEWRNAGVPREWRVAYLGHTEEVNEKSYTKDVRFDHFIDMLGGA